MCKLPGEGPLDDLATSIRQGLARVQDLASRLLCCRTLRILELLCTCWLVNLRLDLRKAFKRRLLVHSLEAPFTYDGGCDRTCCFARTGKNALILLSTVFGGHQWCFLCRRCLLLVLMQERARNVYTLMLYEAGRLRILPRV